MKKTFNTFFGIIFITLFSFIGLGNVLVNKNSYQEYLETSHSITRNINSSLLTDEVESLEITINPVDLTFTYDLTFVDNSFENVNTYSYYFWFNTSLGGFAPWTPEPFYDSLGIVQNAHSSATVSYAEMLDYNENQIVISGLESLFGVCYLNDDYEFVPVVKAPLEFRIYNLESVLWINDTQTNMIVNDDLTFAEINYEFLYDDSIFTPESIILKSHTDSELNHSLYDIDNGISLTSGANSFVIPLMEEYHYQNLYVEFLFSTQNNAIYKWESDINGDLDFVSGKQIEEVEWDTKAIVFLVFIILLILITIGFIILIIGLMKKRRKLEKQQDQAYYDENYEDGMY